MFGSGMLAMPTASLLNGFIVPSWEREGFRAFLIYPRNKIGYSETGFEGLYD